tara:strand:- start:3092 stop:3973 length:882 start_codon:yes stop_codon:yes gene_type:complete
MLDLSYFQNSGNVNTQTFTNAGSWVTWVKPRGAKFVNIMCIGSGGGGGGALIAVGTHGGASGGSAGAFTRATYQASLLPDILYVYTGIRGTGGLGGTAGNQTPGANGDISYVALTPSTSSVSNLVCRSGNTAAGGGPTGSTVDSAGAATANGTTAANCIFLNLGAFLTVNGPAGAIGSFNTLGSSFTISNIVCGGGGGSGGSTTSQGIGGAGPIPSIAGASGAGQPGNNGIMLTKPILAFTGGTSGGSSNSGAPGISGNGSYGCGGAGGSGGISAGGNGGNGGDGIIIITTSF